MLPKIMFQFPPILLLPQLPEHIDDYTLLTFTVLADFVLALQRLNQRSELISSVTGPDLMWTHIGGNR